MQEETTQWEELNCHTQEDLCQCHLENMKGIGKWDILKGRMRDTQITFHISCWFFEKKMCASVYLCVYTMCMPDDPRGQQKRSDPLELEL